MNAPKVDVPTYALNCFNCDVAGPPGSTYSEAEQLAGKSGWVLGLDPETTHGDANFACPECGDLLVNPISIDGTGGAV